MAHGDVCSSPERTPRSCALPLLPPQGRAGRAQVMQMPTPKKLCETIWPPDKVASPTTVALLIMCNTSGTQWVVELPNFPTQQDDWICHEGIILCVGMKTSGVMITIVRCMLRCHGTLQGKLVAWLIGKKGLSLLAQHYLHK
jgi:hypothetical protein